MSQPIRLITHGADLGSFRAANAGILQAHRAGILKNASLLASAPYAEEGAALVRGEKNLCIGLHLSLTSEWDAPRQAPVLPREQVASLIDEDGNFFANAILLHEKGFRMEEVKAELRAQLARARSLDLDIRYVDTHMGFGWIFEREDERAAEWIARWAEEESLVWQGAVGEHLPREAISSPEALIQALEQAAGGDYLVMTHPALLDDEMKPLCLRGGDDESGTINRQRYEDFLLLTDGKLMQFLMEQGIETISYPEAVKS